MFGSCEIGVGMIGNEITTPRLIGFRNSVRRSWILGLIRRRRLRGPDLNRRLPDYESGVLTN